MAIQRTSIDNPEGTVTPIIGEEDVDEYMFFQNLKMIQECVNSMLSMDPKRVNAILRDGHAWATDHISTSKDDIEEVAGFLKGRVTENLDEAKISSFNRILSMSPEWWIAWKQENKNKGYEFKKDAFSKTYEVSKDGKILFVFDYGRNKIFTNQDPSTYILDSPLTQSELNDITKKADKMYQSSTDSNDSESDQDEDATKKSTSEEE
jgi:hypothetical protein